MQKLNKLLPPPTGSLSDWQTSTDQHQIRADHARYAGERARFLFGQYRKGDANDPDTYVASVAAVLSEFSAETIRFVTDPRTGIATHGDFRKWMPNPGEVKQICEAHEQPSCTHTAMDEWDRRSRAQLEERKALEAPRHPKQTRDEFITEMRARGLNIGGQKAAKVEVDEFCSKYGVDRSAWESLPDLPADIEVKGQAR